MGFFGNGPQENEIPSHTSDSSMKLASAVADQPVGLPFHPILCHSRINPVLPPAFWVGFTVSIPRAWDFSANEKQRKVGYVIECNARCGFRWTVTRRYSDFVMLHQQLSILNRMVSRVQGALSPRGTVQPSDDITMQAVETSLPRLPQLPGTHWFQRTNQDDSRINRRRVALEDFLQHVVYTHLYFVSGLLNDFLSLDVAHKVARPAHLHVPLPAPRRPILASRGPTDPSDMADPTAEVGITITAASPPTHSFGYLQRSV